MRFLAPIFGALILVTAFFAPNPQKLPLKVVWEVSTNGAKTWARTEVAYPAKGGWLYFTNRSKSPDVLIRCGWHVYPK